MVNIRAKMCKYFCNINVFYSVSLRINLDSGMAVWKLSRVSSHPAVNATLLDNKPHSVNVSGLDPGQGVNN